MNGKKPTADVKGEGTGLSFENATSQQGRGVRSPGG